MGAPHLSFPCQGSYRISGAPHHILTSLCRCACPVTHIAPCSPLGRCSHRPAPPRPVLLSPSCQGGCWAAQDDGEQAASSGTHPGRRRLLPDSEPRLQSLVEEALGFAHRAISHLLARNLKKGPPKLQT